LINRLQIADKKRVFSIATLTLLLVGTLVLGLSLRPVKAARVGGAYGLTINAYCVTEGAVVNVAIIMDGLPTGYSTPHTFVILGTHNFTMPGTDALGHPFKQWNTGETSTTIVVTVPATYTAYYGAEGAQAFPDSLTPQYPVGGTIVSSNSWELLAPRLLLAALATLAIAATIAVLCIKLRRAHKAG